MFKWDHRRIQVCCVVVFLLFLLLVAARPQFGAPQGYTGMVIRGYRVSLLAGYLACTVFLCSMVLWKGNIKNHFLYGSSAAILFILLPAASFIIFETIAGNIGSIIQNGQVWMFLNLCIWYLLYGAVFAVTNSTRGTAFLMLAFTYVLAVANAFVVMFRGQPIMAMDIRSIRTAASVAGEFQYTPTAEMIIMGLFTVSCCLWAAKSNFKLPGFKSRAVYTLVMAGCIWYGLYGMLVGDVFAKAGSDRMDFFRFNLTYQTEGYMACTMKSIRFLRVEPPEGYSKEAVLAAVDGTGGQVDGQGRQPQNVIVIMNESFSDLSVLGDFEVSEPVLPYMESISDHTKQGMVSVSVYGGGTANTEFEFLTGNTVAFIPAGTIAYQMYVRKGASSIVSLFKGQGYKTVMWHPYRKDNYNRPDVYGIYGFDAYYGKGDIKVKKIRQYASDQSDYKGIIKLYEQKEPGEKLFLFNITMQNHSGYDDKQYNSTVSLTEYPNEFPQAEQFLSLMRESDQALEMLISYFSKVPEDTVILLFGDHQPCLEEDFYKRVMGEDTPENLLSHTQRKMLTPYLLWANYEIEADEPEYIGANYLGTYLLNAANIPMPAFNQYLWTLHKKIPAINVNGFSDAAGNLYWWGEEGILQEELDSYRMLQYNNLFDQKGRIEGIFNESGVLTQP